MVLNKFDHNCQETVINLGTQISDLAKTGTGFMVGYQKGSKCGNNTYNSEINFICDKEAGDGWPELVSDKNCTV